MTIPFSTLSERHLVYVYLLVWVLQFGYGGWLAVQWHRSRGGSAAASEESID